MSDEEDTLEVTPRMNLLLEALEAYADTLTAENDPVHANLIMDALAAIVEGAQAVRRMSTFIEGLHEVLTESGIEMPTSSDEMLH